MRCEGTQLPVSDPRHCSCQLLVCSPLLLQRRSPLCMGLHPVLVQASSLRAQNPKKIQKEERRREKIKLN